MECARCNRKIKDQKSIDRGYGPVCYKKHLKEVRDAEFEKMQVTIDDVIGRGDQMREIKFRGKATDEINLSDSIMNIEDGWVYGNLIWNKYKPFILGDAVSAAADEFYPEWWMPVDPESVGEYIGLKDKNGKEIYKGDISNTDSELMYVDYEDARYGLRFLDPLTNSVANYFESAIDFDELNIIGNIYDNPELAGDSNV